MVSQKRMYNVQNILIFRHIKTTDEQNIKMQSVYSFFRNKIASIILSLFVFVNEVQQNYITSISLGISPLHLE